MKFRKHALHLVVTASMIGGVLYVAAPAAHAVTALPDICGTYLQGTIDPTGGPLPSGIIPLVPAGTPQTYGVFGHLAKGQDKELLNLHQAGTVGTKQTKASLGLTWGGTVTGNTSQSGPNAPYLTVANGGTEPLSGATSMKIAWTTDAKTGAITEPTVQVAEASKQANDAKGAIAKGTVTGTTGADDKGVQVGNLQQGNAVTPLNTIDQVVVPQGASAGSTFTLSMSIPAFAGPPLGGVTLATTAIPMTPTAAQVTSAFDASPTWGALVGPGSAAVTLNSPGNFTIQFQGALAGRGLPLLSAPAANQTNDLSTTVLDDGSIWNAGTMGGVNPSKSPIDDLGNGIVTATGVMSSGPVGGIAGLTATTLGGKIIGGTNTGKANFDPDTQFTFIQYPASLIPLVAPHLSPTNPAVPVLAAIVGLTAAQIGEACGLGGLLAIFCVEDAAVIPSTFAGLCGAITA